MGSKKLVMKFPFRYQEEYNSQMCIYKLWFGDHFFVAGCKRLKKRVLQHSEEIERKLRLGLKERDIYTKVISHIWETGCKEFVVELIFPIALESEIPLYEQRVFDLVRDNPFCLNAEFQAHQRTYQAQSSIYRELKEFAGITEKPGDPPAAKPVPGSGKGKKHKQSLGETAEMGVTDHGDTISANISTTDSFREALKRINQSYAKDSN